MEIGAMDSPPNAIHLLGLAHFSVIVMTSVIPIGFTVMQIVCGKMQKTEL